MLARIDYSNEWFVCVTLKASFLFPQRMCMIDGATIAFDYLLNKKKVIVSEFPKNLGIPPEKHDFRRSTL